MSKCLHCGKRFLATKECFAHEIQCTDNPTVTTPDNANEGEMRTELVGYDEIGSAIRKVKDEPLYTIKQARELVVAEIMECDDLKIIKYVGKKEIDWYLKSDEVIEIINK